MNYVTDESYVVGRANLVPTHFKLSTAPALCRPKEPANPLLLCTDLIGTETPLPEIPALDALNQLV